MPGKDRVAQFSFRIVTYRTGVKVNDQAARTRADAEQFYREAVEAARRTALSQKAPRRVELVHGGAVIASADLPARAPEGASPAISNNPLTT